jgi:hypothetical protein
MAQYKIHYSALIKLHEPNLPLLLFKNCNKWAFRNLLEMKFMGFITAVDTPSFITAVKANHFL